MTLPPDASGWIAQRAQEAINIMESEFTEMCNNIGREYTRPSVVFKAKLTKYLGSWCAYIPRGNEVYPAAEFFGVGKTPDEAMRNFDKAWITP